MYKKLESITNEPIWVRTNSKGEILFEGSYEDALKFNKGNFMTKTFYMQYKEEMNELFLKITS